MFCARSSVIFWEFAVRTGVPFRNDTSLSCTVSSAGTWANRMGSVEREDIDGRSNDTCG